MFEGHNEILFSKETAHKLFSKFMSNLFNSPTKVTDIETDYKGVKIEFTEDAETDKTEALNEDNETKEREV